MFVFFKYAMIVFYRGFGRYWDSSMSCMLQRIWQILRFLH